MKSAISLREARRYALTAQVFNAPDREADVGRLQLRRAVERLGVLQIDSVSVLVRSHYLPLFSRLGTYERAQLDSVLSGKNTRFFEYWGHEASFLPLDCQPLLRWRMARALRGEGVWTPLQTFAHERRAEADAMLERIRADGPIAASDVESSKASTGMWARSDAKRALEWLFWAGLVTATHRRTSFERVYDLPERVLPGDVLASPTPRDVDAHRALLARSAEALGIAAADDLRDYYRIPAPDVAVPLQQLVDEGMLIPVRVDGWRQQAYLHKDARAGRRTEGAALLSPFDPLVWHRPRTERLFAFRYRLEIYTPAHKREHGYYVLPFLLDGALVARVDLKSDRKAGTLIVQKATIEPDAPAHTRDALNAELDRMARWLNLQGVTHARS
ncbi:hypothetical protein SAMN02800694_2941 [Luteibacter sp. UNCMF331Sha3.1]|uniref:winged helix-turn-helix domain-containing protein n=1 Tax=Luteibacter sp. UNCMF331Sha3.1 TaxID=1502760 RepID=UPI0008BCB739|nr:crosslink repair DNA glycosylase YcaQ family protein [Luteibacter sp. UNCMF331Sha3.1]SEN15670.1 hypothetical protein SAMN02800694_2941 [Luteibacter sp. UNCMF331Sha3.1]